ncbi:hypothetical protein JOM56_002743 [Amanita muscaria]
MKIHEASLLIPASFYLGEKWRQVLPLDSITVIELMLDAARAIQYLHSMGVAPSSGFGMACMHLDLSLRPKIRIAARSLHLINPCTRPTSEPSLYGGNVFDFGCFFYAVYFNTEISYNETMEEKERIVANRPSKPKIPDYTWQFIQRCCAKDPMNRPTIDEVVKEMETWRNEPK